MLFIYFIRNYMEHVSENIADWVNIEETKYQAEMREKDLARQRELALSRASTPAPSRPSSSKSRKGSAKKSRSKSPKGRLSALRGMLLLHISTISVCDCISVTPIM